MNRQTNRVVLGCVFFIWGLFSAGLYALTPAQYTVLTPLDATALQSNDPQKPSVTEFFSFACLHCFHLEKPLATWVKRHQSNIAFQKIPVTWGRASWRYLAKAYYISHALGLSDTLNLPMFKAIHHKGVALDDAKTLALFLKPYGVSQETFDAYNQSPTIDHQVNAANQLAMAFKIDQVPTFVVNGRFQTDVAKAGGEKQLFEVLDALIVKAKAGE